MSILKPRKAASRFMTDEMCHRQHHDGSWATGAELPPAGRYWSDEGELLAIRGGYWTVVFEEQRSTGLGVWRVPFSPSRVPKVFNLRSDPFERGDESSLFYDKWNADHTFMLVPAQVIASKWLESVKEFPPRAKAVSFSVDQVIEMPMPKCRGPFEPIMVD